MKNANLPSINFSDKLSFDILNDRFEGYSYSSMYYQMKKMFGISLFEFKRINQINLARKLLINETFTISEIAYKVGFNDPKYFSKEFKKRFGLTPTEFKNRYGDKVPNTNTKLIEKFNCLIETNNMYIGEGLSKITSDMCMSRSTLHRKIKAATGYSTVEYVRLKRMRKAIHIMSSSNMSLCNLADILGFKDYRHFSRCLRKTNDSFLFEDTKH
ncbi:MAG: AraC family transcriptional regulator [Paludibacter sp.]|nr:AraC family transcriptional regulator [Paludibacter sp.]